MLAFGMDADATPPGVAERTLGDVVDPFRPGSPTAVVNAVSRAIGGDAAEWSVARLFAMAGQLEREGRERARQG